VVGAGRVVAGASVGDEGMCLDARLAAWNAPISKEPLLINCFGHRWTKQIVHGNISRVLLKKPPFGRLFQSG
jgi:hypothetical protein